MRGLSEEGRQIVDDIARRHGVSSDAASQLLSALAAGGGSQAQFNHPELGGMGQWSQGGMIMIGDMFNHGLKAKVDALCNELAGVLQTSSPFVPAPTGSSGSRWPAELGTPSSTGSQNDMHYAVFPGSRRLAIEQRGLITVYDTGDHRIGGASQQQSGDQSLSFTSQLGRVSLSELKIVGDQAKAGDAPVARPNPAARDTDATPGAATPETDESALSGSPVPSQRASGSSDDEIFSRLERLADLQSRGIISAEEFAAKKAELLSRL